jgi:hypothetical protein
MRTTITLLVLIQSFCAFGAKPTVEGLFTNGKNKEIEGNMVAFTFKLESETQMISTQALSNEEVSTTEAATVEKQKESSYYKMIFFLPQNRKKEVELLQVVYSAGDFSKPAVANVKYFPRLMQRLSAKATNSHLLMYGLISMFTLNKADTMVKLLSNLSGDFKRNKDLMSEEKLALFRKYKDYLKAIKDDPSLKETLESPLKPKDPEKAKEVKEIMSGPMYTNEGTVKLVQDGERFLWKFVLAENEGEFFNDSNLLKNLRLKNSDGFYNVNVGEYISFDGIHVLPKVIHIDDTQNMKKNVIYPRSYRVYSIQENSLRKRHRDYLKILKKNIAEGPEVKININDEIML